MINLMPDDYKESIRFARRNTILLHWLMGVVVILVLASSTILVGRAYLQSETRRYAATNQATETSLKERDIEATFSKVENISTNLKLIVQVLSQQVIFSKLLQQIGTVMPPGTVLSGLEITKTEGGIDITADATNQTAATQVQVNLVDPENKLFEKVDIVSIKCDNASKPDYPCTVILRALFAKDNPFSFLNQKSGANQ